MGQDSQLTSAQYCFHPEISIKSLTPKSSIRLQLLTLGGWLPQKMQGPKICRFFQAELL